MRSLVLMLIVVSPLAGAQERWRLVPDLVLPETAKAPLTQVRSIAEGPDGELLVLDRRGVYRFQREGQFLGEVGRRTGSVGPGPGEYAAASAIGVVSDRIWLADGAAPRVTWFDREGEVIETWLTAASLGQSQRGYNLSVIGVIGEESILVLEKPQTQQGSGYADHRALWGLVDRAGRIKKSLSSLDVAEMTLRESLPPATQVVMRQPFSFADAVSIDPYGRKVLAVRRMEGQEGRGEYSLTAFDERWEVLYEAKREVELAVLDDSDIDRWLDSLIAERAPQSRRRLPDRVMRDVLDGGLYRPIHYPPIPNHPVVMFVSPVAHARDGSVWVRRTRIGEGRWDVFDHTGAFLGEAIAPSDVELYLILGDEAFGIRHDGLGVPQIVKLAIESS